MIISEDHCSGINFFGKQMTFRYDFPQFGEQHSLPQTSVIYKDRFSNQYLIFIDFDMNLHIYNITTYVSDITEEAIKLVSVTDLYKYQNLSPDKQCTNLIILEEGRMMANCLSNSANDQGSFDGVTAIIDIKDMSKVIVRFFVNYDDFQAMKEGKYRFLKKVNYTYMIMVKKYKTHCYFNIESMDGFLPPKIIRQIKSFDDPQAYTDNEWREKYEKNQDDHLISGSCQQRENVNQNQVKNIDYLQIQDMRIIPFQDDVVVASDYNYGLLFLNISCVNLTFCYYYPRHHLKEFALGDIYILDDDSFDGEKVMFVQKLTPPGILEVNLENPLMPSFQKAYYISQDKGDYMTIDILAANKQYVLTQFMSIKDMKPVIRIFKRTATYFSIGHSQLNYIDFIDEGTFVHFLHVDDNYFLLKTSDDFRILQIKDQQLVINSTNYDLLLKRNIINQTIQVNLEAIDYQFKRLPVTFDIIFLETADITKMFANYLNSRDRRRVFISYSCSLNPSQQIFFDNYFQGQHTNRLKIVPLGSAVSDFFEIRQHSNDQQQVYQFKGQDCFLPGILTLYSQADQEKVILLMCIKYGKSSVDFITFNSQQTNNTLNTKFNFTIPQSTIIEYDSDPENKYLFVLSNKTSEDKQGAVIHFFRFYNIFTWDCSIDLNKRFPELGGQFYFRYKNSLTYDQAKALMVVTGNPETIDNLFAYKQVVFKVEKSLAGFDLKLLSIIFTKIPKSATGQNQLRIIQSKINQQGLWTLFSNNTLNHYIPQIFGFKSQGYNSQNTNISQKYIKKQQFQFSDGIFSGTQIWNFKVNNDLFAFFIGDDIVLIQKFNNGTYEFEKIMQLPIYLDEEKGQDKVLYKFIMNSFIGIVDTDRYDNFIFFTCSKQINQTFEGYYVFAFDMKKSKHLTLIFKSRLNITQEQLNADYYNLRIQSLSQNSIRIVINLNDKELLYLNYNYQQYMTIKNDEKVYQQFAKKCKQGGFDQIYKIYPENQPDEDVDFVINVENNGNIIYQDIQNDTLVISKDTDSLNTEDKLQGRYSLLSNFHGQDMNFRFKCIQNSNQENEMIDCGYIEKSQDTATFNRSLDFLGSKVQLLGFFVMEPYLVFFDKKYFSIYYPDSDMYEQYLIREIFPKVTPAQFFTFSYTNQNRQKTYIIMCQDIHLKFQITFAYLSYSYDTSTMIKQIYFQTDENMYFLKSDEYTHLVLNITLAQIYVKNNPKDFIAILSLDQQDQSQHSKINFFRIRQVGINIVYEFLKDHILSVNRLGVDTFKINSLAVYKNYPQLFIGVQNFGIITYDLENFKTIRFQSIMKQIPSPFFGVSQIIPESLCCIYLVVNGFGVLSLHYMDDKMNISNQHMDHDDMVMDDEPTVIIHYLFDDQIEAKAKNALAKSKYGYAYIERVNYWLEHQTDYFKNQIRFISYYSMEDSKSLGTAQISYDEECEFIQRIPYTMSQDYLQKRIDEDYLTVASVCAGTELRIVAFNYHPQIIVNMNNKDISEIYTQQLEVDAWRTHEQASSDDTDARSNSSISTMILNIRLHDPSRRIPPIIYLFLVLGIIVLLFILSVIQKHIIKIKKDDKNKKSMDLNNLSQSFMKQDSTVSDGKASLFGDSERPSKTNGILSYFIKKQRQTK